jgi:N-acyl-D-amino-acid deacylase
MRRRFFLSLVLAVGCAPKPDGDGVGPSSDATSAQYDVIIRNGQIYDGLGGPPVQADLAIDGERIAKVGDLGPDASADLVVDAHGLAVAPGFTNILSWATASLIADGRSQGDIRQGVTLEVFGEGTSMGPLNPELVAYMKARQGDIQYDIGWSSLAEYFAWMEARGISPNIASFVGANTVRANVVGFENRAATKEELAQMQAIVHQAMREGALGVGSALIYAPGNYASTEELVALATASAEHGGMYITHMRSEANQLLEAVEETITIAEQSGARAEIYHLKAAGKDNWPKLDAVIERIEEARAGGLEITADMYNYEAGATGLSAAMPPWVQAGGFEKWVERLEDPKIRKKVIKEMRSKQDDWENLMQLAGGGDKVVLASFKNPELKPLTGKTLAEVAKMRGKSEEETAMDLVVEDGSRVGAIYFLMSEENVKKKIGLPWVAFCSDAGSEAPEGVFLKSKPHPRAYGSFARLLGHYVRDERVISLPEAIRRLTSFPAQTLRIKDRGQLAAGYFADVVIFDPATISDHATYEDPHQYATGVRDVFVNGVAVLKDGEHTGAKPGRAIRGPGYEP